MPIANVYEGSSHPVELKLVDRLTGAPIIPTSATWTLKNGPSPTGEIVNARENIFLSPDEIMEIVLEPDDTQFGDGAKRVLIVDATYDSVDFGDGLVLTYWETFKVVKRP